MQILHYGERIRVLAKLRRPRNFRNPGAFDYEEYLTENGIAALEVGRRAQACDDWGRAASLGMAEAISTASQLRRSHSDSAV